MKVDIILEKTNNGFIVSQAGGETKFVYSKFTEITQSIQDSIKFEEGKSYRLVIEEKDSSSQRFGGGAG